MVKDANTKVNVGDGSVEEEVTVGGTKLVPPKPNWQKRNTRRKHEKLDQQVQPNQGTPSQLKNQLLEEILED